MNEVIVQMGSFNPLHRMHKRIADDAIAKYPDGMHMMCMAVQTCDKGENSLEILAERSRAISDAGYMAVYSDSGLFVDVIKELYTEFPGDRLVFPVGEDTLYRFFRDWDKYYNEKYPDEYLRRFTDYADIFDNVEWYVSRRECIESTQYFDLFALYVKHHDNVVWSSLGLDDISSTKIRNGGNQ